MVHGGGEIQNNVWQGGEKGMSYWSGEIEGDGEIQKAAKSASNRYIWIMIWSQLFNTVLKKHTHTIQTNVEFLLEIDAKS
jgi:hypothetical protein